MTSSQDFKQAIRAGNINEAFLVAMSNAPELNITTKIITSEGNRPQGDNSLKTHISLIEGKIENEIGEQLTGDRYTEIQQFHIEQVTQGHQTIQHNLISLQKMFQLMSAFQEQQDTGHSNWVDIAANVAREPLPGGADNTKLYSHRTPEALAASRIDQTTSIATKLNSEADADNPEPQLPSFVPEDEDDHLVDDLLSLTDLVDEDDRTEKVVPQEEQEDWGEWLDSEPEVKPEVFDLKSLNIREASQNWHDWNTHDQPDSNPES